MQSLARRLNGTSKEAIEYLKVYGRLKFMEKYQVKDYCSVIKFLEDMGLPANFGTAPVLNESGRQPLAVEFVDAVFSYVNKVEAKNNLLQAELEKARVEVEYFKKREAELVEAKMTQIMARVRG